MLALTDLDAKRAQLRLRAERLRDRGLDLTKWLEDELATAEDESGIVAIDIELTTREREHYQSRNSRWLVRLVWIFVIVVILAHALSR